jgi:hypothetical protein
MKDQEFSNLLTLMILKETNERVKHCIKSESTFISLLKAGITNLPGISTQITTKISKLDSSPIFQELLIAIWAFYILTFWLSRR